MQQRFGRNCRPDFIHAAFGCTISVTDGDFTLRRETPFNRK
jgi:hypothetical protein